MDLFVYFCLFITFFVIHILQNQIQVLKLKANQHILSKDMNSEPASDEICFLFNWFQISIPYLWIC